MRLALVLAGISLATCAAADRLEWSAAPVTQGSPYVAKERHAAAVDPWNDRFLAIGHCSFCTRPPAAYGFAAAYRFATSAWSLIDTTGGPYIITNASSVGALDRARHRLLILEQSDHDTTTVKPLWQLGLGPDTWTALAQAGDVPEFLFGSSAAVDSAGDALLLFGGVHATAPYGRSNGVWSTPLEGAPDWTQLAPLGDPPSPRSEATVAFDEANRQLVVFGGSLSWREFSSPYLNDAWRLSLDPVPAWQEVTTSRRPPASAYTTGAWDPVTEHLVVFTEGDVWELVADPTPEWFVRRVASSGSKPPSRAASTLSADARTGRLYLHGGVVLSSDILYLDPTLWVLSRSATSSPAVEAPEVVTYIRQVPQLIPFTIVNPASAPRTFDWRLSADVPIPGIPSTGTAAAPTNGLGGFDVPVTVPNGTPVNFAATMSIHATGDAADSASVVVAITRHHTDAVDPRVVGLRFDGAIPNPANALPWLSFHLPQAGVVRLDLLDLGGRRVASRGPMMATAGPNLVPLVATKSLAPGMYFGRLVYQGHSLFARVAIIR